jgi:TolB-like protein/DNA-binding winged helix-turn-helix (wHTH) protein/predicted Zn-dependent protease
MTNKPEGLLEFENFRLDTAQRLLFSGDQIVPLSPKAFDTLQVLIEAGGRIVVKEELLKKVWPDTFVEEGSLARNISILRKALGESPDDQKFIQTIPKRGYRFVAPVKPAGESDKALVIEEHTQIQAAFDVETDSTTESGPAMPKRWRLSIVIGCLVVVTAAVVGVLAFQTGAKQWDKPSAIQSIAVLPLQNLSGDASQEYFSDGMTEALISSLAQIHALGVTSRTSIMRYKGTTKSVPEIGKELGVDAIVEGSVRRSGGRVRVSAQLIRAATDRHLWANDYEAGASDVLKLQSEIAQAIAREVQPQITPEEPRRLASAPAVNPEAQDLYMLGRYHYWRNNMTEIKLAIGYLDKAIAAQPDNAASYAALSHAWADIFDAEATSEARERAHSAARKAVELDPESSDAHDALGSALIEDMDWKGAESELKLSLKLNPDNVEACGCYAAFLSLLGRFPEAIASGARGVKLNPLSSWTHMWYGFALYFGRRYEDAVPILQRAIELDATNLSSYSLLSTVYLKLGRAGDAIALLDRPEFRSDPSLAVAYAQSGRKGDARRILLDMMKPGSKFGAYGIGWVYLSSEDLDHGFEWLSKSVDRKEARARTLKFNPAFDEVRSDPRFQALVARLNIPD